MNLQDKLIIHLRKVFAGKFKVVVEGAYEGGEVDEDYDGEKYVSFNHLTKTGSGQETYYDWYYEDFTPKKIIKTLKEEIKNIDNFDCDEQTKDEYMEILKLTMNALNSFDIGDALPAGKYKPDTEKVMWEKVWEMFEEQDYHDRHMNKEKLIKRLQKKFEISKHS